MRRRVATINFTIRFLAQLFCIASFLLNANADRPNVDRYGFYEAGFQSSGKYKNPYLEIQATAALQLPDNAVRELPVFWDGGNQWKLRISPDLVGEWKYKIQSNDEGLNNKTGEFLCIASNLCGGVRPMQKSPRHFSYQNGVPFLFWGDTAWALFQDSAQEKLDRAAVFHYIDMRAAEGVNVVHSMLLSEAGWGNRGGDPFEDVSKEMLNPGYWQEVDIRLQYLNEKRIACGLALAWGDKNRQAPWPWRRFPGVEARKRYARYIAARYGAYNVYFIVSGEWNAEANTRDATREQVKQEFIEIGDALQRADAHQRMIAIHPMTRDGSTREFNRAAWMSFADYQQNYPELHARVLQSRSFNKPIVNSEYGYYLRDASENGTPDKNNSLSADDMRFATWDIIMAGGYPVTGYGTTYFGGNRDPGPFHPDDPRNKTWTQQYVFAKQVLSGGEWWKLEPNDGAIHCTQPRSKDRRVKVEAGRGQTRKLICPPIRTYWLLEEPGARYVAYGRGVTQAVTIDLGENAEGDYQAIWVGPTTGESKTLARKIHLNKTYEFTPPDESDWVMTITKLNQQ